jgi:uncharacterized protein
MFFLAALLLGLASSLHCVGMCGPLMLALPYQDTDRFAVVRQMLVYHSGRILTYTGLGVLFGLLGQGLSLAGLQQFLSISAGIFMFAMALLAWQYEQIVTALPGFGRFTKWVQFHLSQRLRNTSHFSYFSIGLLNGLLPCGMVYAALAGAIATTKGATGGLFMAVFGLGTLPLLFMAMYFGRSFKNTIRQQVKVIQPVLFMVVGLLLLQRGLNMNIAFFEAVVPGATFDCH